VDDDELLAAAAEVLLRRAAKRSAPSLTVAALFALYEASQKHRKHWPAVRNKLSAFLAAFGDRDVMSLTVRDWTEHASKRLSTPAPPKGDRCYSVATVNVELVCVKVGLNWGVTQGHLRYNPIAAARRFKARKGRDTAPSETEVGRCLAACLDGRQRVLVLGAADVGLRVSEIAQLRHDWIDAERKTISLPDWCAKNGRGGRVPCTQRFLDAVAALPRHFSLPQVLYSETSRGAYSRRQLDTWWAGIRERSGIEAAPGDRAVHLHDLRAGAATNALDRGVRLETVSRRILRHSSLATTEIYLRGKDVGNLEQAIEAMEAGIVRDQRRGPKRSADAGAALREDKKCRASTEQTSGSEHS